MTTQEIYDNLMNLCSTNNAFVYSDQISPAGGLYRVFSYRLASYTDFCAPSARETRGSMWEIDTDGNVIRCASRTMDKFFNAYENPFVMFDKSMLSTEIEVIMLKLDGSIISTYTDTDKVIRCKSHTALYSDHAINSTELLHSDSAFYQYVSEAEQQHYTVNMEYTSPKYQIVLPYQCDKLTVLNVRCRDTGKILCGEALQKRFPMLYRRTSNIFCGNIDNKFPMHKTVYESIQAVYEMKDIEGFVGVLKDGTMFKAKTNWYSALHHTKDSIMVQSRLYVSVLEGASDDLRQMFQADPESLAMIDRMEQLVFSCYNALHDEVHSFVNKHKHLGRKEFAVEVQKSLSKELNRQGLAFALYNGKVADFKETMLKYSDVVLKDY